MNKHGGLAKTYPVGCFIRSSRSLHIPERYTFFVGHETILANEPVGVFSCCVLRPLFNHDAKDIRQVFVQGPRLVFIQQAAVELCDGVLSRSALCRARVEVLFCVYEIYLLSSHVQLHRLLS